MASKCLISLGPIPPEKSALQLLQVTQFFSGVGSDQAEAGRRMISPGAGR